MAKEKGYIWAILDAAGIVPLAVGTLGVISVIPIGLTASSVLLAAGIIIITVSSAFIALNSSRFRKEYRDFIRFDEIRTDARLVPNNLREGYVIDYTADADCAISYTANEPEPQMCGGEQDSGDRESAPADRPY
ncbi:MAG: hypothetical protein LBJ20_02920 [Candidatus Methanoplasma sp.]|jgi:hypothetical protein|nr:hypothetical protein [Candidatus Methanoplasma sp.]